ncbi:hypothetical protein C8N39_11267 [Dietzia psychralcaliphila]|nr:hypothetical protein C8N39_11267 [Dietzia psychralcaliphila]
MGGSYGAPLGWITMRNLLPAWLDFTLLAITWAAILWRVYTARSGGAPRRLTESLTAGAVALTLKVGPIYDVVEPLLGAAILRALIHGACLVAVAGVILLWFATQGDVKHPRLVPVLYAISGGLTVLLVITAAVAPRAGDQMESAPSGWALWYFAIFCLPTLVGLFLLVKQLIGSWGLSRSRLVGAVVTLVYAFLVIDNFTVFVAVGFSALRDDHSLLDGRGVPNGVVFAVLLTIGAVISALVANRGAEDSWVDPMTAMWLDLRTACPEVALSDPWSLRGKEQRLRAIVESVDALAHLAPLVNDRHMRAARKVSAEPPALVLALAIQDAAMQRDRRTDHLGDEGLLAVDAVGQAGELSVQWQRAKQLRHTAGHGSEKGFSRGVDRFAPQSD